MNVSLDYDTLEMLGAAIRDSRSKDLRDPLPEDLRELCHQLNGADGSQGEDETRQPEPARPHN